MNHATFDPADTEDLLQRAQAGEGNAVNTLLARHLPYLHKIAALRLDARLRSRLDPSDVVQDVQLEAVRRLEGYLRQRPMPFRLWLRKLICDRVLMLHRYHFGAARRSVTREAELPDHSSLLLAQRLFGQGSTPSRRCAKEELITRVRHAVARLPETDREIILMRTIEGLAFEEVALLLGVESAVARKRHGRALLRLHRLLSEDGLTESNL
jgi:RNA polymerase sigma-70 factor (ECF subfamily)